MSTISISTISGYWKNISDWVKGADAVSSPHVTLSGRNIALKEYNMQEISGTGVEVSWMYGDVRKNLGIGGTFSVYDVSTIAINPKMIYYKNNTDKIRMVAVTGYAVLTAATPGSDQLFLSTPLEVAAGASAWLLPKSIDATNGYNELDRFVKAIAVKTYLKTPSENTTGTETVKIFGRPI